MLSLQGGGVKGVLMVAAMAALSLFLMKKVAGRAGLLLGAPS
jgi:hypothetical protein